jgi:uroporphyrin-III C-methyltransferase
MREKTSGKIYLIGAGPGDVELLTIKAARVLALCDVVLYDRLVGREILAFARPDAELIYVGKRDGEQDHKQQEIFDLLVAHAREGKTVGRLKGGDPLVFGRGAEEWLLALDNGIDVEFIPGISSAVSVPGLAGIPLTYRGVSHSFAVIAGHCREDLEQDWTRFSQVDTLVILMGVKNRSRIAQALIAAGRPENEPAAFVTNGGRQGQETVECTLGAVARGEVDVESPAVFVIGEVVNASKMLRAAAAALITAG